MVIAERYRLARRIGAGGMGEVWAAEHVVTGRKVAAKALFGSVAPGSSGHRRFLHEARSATAIDHAAIVQVFDAFVSDGVPVIVMELCQGETLAERLERAGTLSVSEMATILAPVVEAVGAAHRKGIAHRDLKPENVFLADEDGAVRPKVLDFGLAKLLVEEGAHLPHAAPRAQVGPSTQIGPSTQVGTAIGTPAYMAPEQAAGDPSADHRVDIWALGVIVYRCLAGVLPIEGDTAAEVLVRIARDAITPLDVLAPDLPPPLVALVARMLSRKPDGRPGDVDEVLQLLRTLREPTAPGGEVGAAAALWFCPTCAATSDRHGKCDRDGTTRVEAVDPLGSLAGGFRLTERMGGSDVAETYRAVHADSGRRAAVKIFAAAVAPDAVARFFSDALAIRRLGHPNIGGAVDLGRLADGRAYATMELIEGWSLGRMIELYGPAPIELVSRVAVDGLAALDAGHAAGVVHGDLKPENVFVTASGAVRLLDFGMGRLHAAAAASPPSATLTDAALTPPHYLAPEQIEGAALDPRTDLYALGVVLYEAATGRYPFHGPSASAVMQQHLHATPPPARQLREELPAALDRAIAWALAKDPAARPQTARELAARLTTEDDQPTSAAAPTLPATVVAPAPAVVRAAPRGWLALVLAAVAIVLAGVAIAVLL
jgi:serine/threonine-protein kinase